MQNAECGMAMDSGCFGMLEIAERIRFVIPVHILYATAAKKVAGTSISECQEHNAFCTTATIRNVEAVVHNTQHIS